MQYVLKIAPVEANCIGSGNVHFSRTNSGSTGTDTLADDACLSYNADNGYSEFYSLSGDGSNVTITLESSAFDVHLYLRNGEDVVSGSWKADNYKVAASGERSVSITRWLPRSEYTIEVTSHSPDQTGAYTLSATFAAQTATATPTPDIVCPFGSARSSGTASCPTLTPTPTPTATATPTPTPTATPTAAPQLPAVPTGLTTTPGDGSITLDWNDAASATGYQVQQWQGSIVSVSASQATLTGLTNGTLYYHRVRSYNGGGIPAGAAGFPNDHLPQPPRLRPLPRRRPPLRLRLPTRPRPPPRLRLPTRPHQPPRLRRPRHRRRHPRHRRRPMACRCGGTAPIPTG